MRTKIKGHIINLLLDPGSTHTIMTSTLQEKLKLKNKGSTYLRLEAVAGCSADCPSEKFTLGVPTREGVVEITGYKINKPLTEVEGKETIDLNKMWPSLDEKIKEETSNNRFEGQVDIIIGQDNFWSLVSDEIVKHPSEKFGFIKTKLGWTMSGSICTVSPMKWQRKLAEKINICYNNINVLQNSSNKEIEETLVRLFEKEEEIENENYTVEEQYAVDSFLKNVKREKDGRYTVSPLFKEINVPIKNNYYHARKRYMALRSSLGRDELKNKTYNEAIQQMIQNKEVEEVIESPSKTKNMDAYLNYLPHHGVFKMDRLSTKCRIVFDGSAKNSEGVSLNSNLLPGPKRQLDIVKLLINFRLHPYTIVGDISRMFWGINLEEKYRDYYRFLWSDDPNKEPKIYRFKRLTMGTVDSPFLAINTVHYHLEQIIKTNPELTNAANFIKNHLYVDDLLGAIDSEKEAILLRKQIQEIFAKMQMRITKWSSNSTALLKTIPKEELSPYEEVDENHGDITFGDPEIVSQSTKCLGMSWTPKTDVLNYNSYESLSQLEGKALKLTKRGISSVIPRIYDPTGLLQPFILKGKLILQSAWTYRKEDGKALDWDDNLPEEIKNRWLKWIAEIKEVSKFEVKRYLFTTIKNVPNRDKLYLHGFADAGEQAWGIAIYIRYLNEVRGLYESNLIYSATRVAPTKTKLSIPKKELNGILLVCEKLIYIAEALGIKIENTFAHTDSLVSLHWVNKDKNTLRLYVSNRVNKIQQTNIKILFTPGTQNPADLCSKPKPGRDYINNPFWTTGPSYLQQNDNSWLEKYDLKNVVTEQLSEKEMDFYNEELKKTMLEELTQHPTRLCMSKIGRCTAEKTPTTVQINTVKTEVIQPEGIYGVMNKYSNFTTALNIIAQCFRALALMTNSIKDESRRNQLTRGFNIHRISSEISKEMSSDEQRKMHITPSITELNFARDFLIMEAQKLHYPEEYECLEKGETISEKSKLIKLNPQLKNGIMIMRGRLDNLHNMPEQMKNPKILPKNAEITEKLILWYHQMTAHSGPELTLRNIRLHYWILGGRQQIRKAIKLCGHKICKYPNIQPLNQQIANLPIARITPGNFESISLDFAGPFTIKRCGVCKNKNICHNCKEKIAKVPNIQGVKCSTQKVYICVFACHSSRAVHLELLMDKTAESFMLAIKRMTNRRSMPKIIHSDNAAEIVKGKKHIKSLYEKLNTAATHKELMTKFQITWYHSSERSPQHNGVIERIVQTVKKPLYKVLDGKILTETEMNTLLTDCEAASNMRPLSATSESADDDNLIPITPSHLILGKALNPLPLEINEHEEKQTKNDVKMRWKQRKEMSQYYWSLWKKEYLMQLRELTKNYCVKRNVKKGDLVLDLVSRITKRHWPLAIVEEALEGRGGVRSVWLRQPLPANKVTKEGRQLTQHKYVKRGIEQISLLEEALEETSQDTNQNE